LLSICPGFKKHGIKALLEYFSIKVSALPDKATAAVNNHARGGQRFLIRLDPKISHGFELNASNAKSLSVIFFQVRQHGD